LTFKRYIKKNGKQSGPYYYHNIKTRDGQAKTIYLGTKEPSPFRLFHIIIILLFFLIIVGGVLFLSQLKFVSQPKTEESLITTDEFLIKVLLKQGESITREISVMNTGQSKIDVTIEREGIGDLIFVDENSFGLEPGQTKTVNVEIISKNDKSKTSYSPGVYVGGLILRSSNGYKKIPVIIEIESKNVLFDMNININAQDRIIWLGDSKDLEIRLFNLGKISPTNVLMEYEIKDLNGNLVFTESESVVVVSQASFYKTINMPSNLNSGQYVFNALARYGTSVGTSSVLLDVQAKEIKESNLYYENISNFFVSCSGNPGCLITLTVLLLIIFILGSYTYFFIGAYIYSKVNKNFLHTPTATFRLESMYEQHPVKYHKAWPFILIAVLLSFVTVGVFYYKGLLPKLTIYFSQLRLSRYINLSINTDLYIYLIIGGLLILTLILLVLRNLFRKR